MNSHDGSYTYSVLRRAIEAIDHADAPLSLDQLAQTLNMSPAHFQRLFSKWVGVSPKRYQQYLTLDQCKALLNQRHSTLETAHQAGLSGSGRLHDLFLRWEAMSPGEFARQGDTVTINFSWMDSPFGEALIMGTNRGLCGIAFTAETGRSEAFNDMAARWPKAHFMENAASLKQWGEAAFGRSGETPLHLIGAPFQIKVWEALLKIPSGYVTTYSDIAQCIGAPKAVRAVGTAVGRNPISWLIPCHRALHKSGALGGYHWGLPVKRTMLAYEAARSEAK